jgi:hypothetical protein
MPAHRETIGDFNATIAVLNATIVARVPNVSTTARAAKSNPRKPA